MNDLLDIILVFQCLGLFLNRIGALLGTLLGALLGLF